MRKFSRSMPKAPPKRVIPTGACLLTLLVIVLLALAFSMTAFLVVVGIIILITIVDALGRRRLRHLAASRVGESICTFARSFDRRSVDPWVIRAVYEEFRAYFDDVLPIRATDRISDDLHMDWEDFNDLAADVAFRAGRSLKHLEQNPLAVEQISNVGDLVLFLSHQPAQYPA
jgi:hypothetical protein